VRVLHAAHPDDPGRDMALTGELLREVARGGPAVARVFRPGATLAFGRLDAREPGFPAAAAAARAHGFTPLTRLGGGRAAAYDQGSVVVEVIAPSAALAEGLQERFAAGADLLAGAFADVGVAVELGELPGEFCPGRFSLHTAAGVKVAGLAQRSVRGASLVTGMAALEGGDRLRAVLEDVQEALGIAWDPRTAGDAGSSAAAFAAAAAARLAAG
jgi:lipoate-protein ligase A